MRDSKRKDGPSDYGEAKGPRREFDIAGIVSDGAGKKDSPAQCDTEKRMVGTVERLACIWG